MHFQSPQTAEQQEDVESGLARLRSAGIPCTSFRGGAHVFDDHIAELLVRLGCRADTSAVPGLVRVHRTPGGLTTAAYADIWDSRPYWYRPGLLELPLASFPLERPYAFFTRRFRLPLLLSDPAAYAFRLRDLSDTRWDEDVPVVAMGHSYELLGESSRERLVRALHQLRDEHGVVLSTVCALTESLIQGRLQTRLGTPPGPIRRGISQMAASAARRWSALQGRAE